MHEEELKDWLKCIAEAAEKLNKNRSRSLVEKSYDLELQNIVEGLALLRDNPNTNANEYNRDRDVIRLQGRLLQLYSKAF